MRLIVMGSKALVEGFALVGFETFPDATPERVEQVLSDLLKKKEKALVFLESTLSNSSEKRRSTPALPCARREGAHLIITEIPPLNTPEAYQPAVEDLVRHVLGTSVLDKLT